MIIYHHPTAVSPPPFLMGARELAISQRVGGGYLYGIGPIYLLGGKPEDGVDVGDGWTAWVNGAVDTFAIRRELVGQPVVGVPDIEDRIWAVPIITNEDGGRAFPVRYGKGYAPILSKEQARLLGYAQEARVLVPRILAAKSAELDELMPVACGMAAAALSYTNHIQENLFSELGLIDTALAIGVLTAMSSDLSGVSNEPDSV